MRQMELFWKVCCKRDARRLYHCAINPHWPSNMLMCRRGAGAIWNNSALRWQSGSPCALLTFFTGKILTGESFTTQFKELWIPAHLYRCLKTLAPLDYCFPSILFSTLFFSSLPGKAPSNQETDCWASTVSVCTVHPTQRQWASSSSVARKQRSSSSMTCPSWVGRCF